MPPRLSRYSCLFTVALFLSASFARAGLIHRYSFMGDTVKDSVGTVDGNLKNGAKLSDGKLVLDNGSKTSDDDKLQYVEFKSSVLPKDSKSCSLVIWFTAKENSPFARLLNIGDKDGAEGRAFIYFTARTGDDQNRVAISATDTASKTNIDGDRLDDGKQHCVAIVIDGTAKKLHVFVDGKEPNAAADLGDNTLDKVKPTDSWIGRSSFDQDAGLTASIEEFRVYDNALTKDEVDKINKSGAETLPQ